jgi:hypothetical protein
VFRDVARCSRIRLGKRISLLMVAARCRILCRRWRQRDVNLASWQVLFSAATDSRPLIRISSMTADLQPPIWIEVLVTVIVIIWVGKTLTP